MIEMVVKWPNSQLSQVFCASAYTRRKKQPCGCMLSQVFCVSVYTRRKKQPCRCMLEIGSFYYSLTFKQMERKLATRLLIIIGIWIIGWTPLAVLTAMQLFGYGLYINKIFPMSAMVLCKISSVLNCGIYGMR